MSKWKKLLIGVLATICLGALLFTLKPFPKASRPQQANNTPPERRVEVVQVVQPKTQVSKRDIRIPASLKGYFATDLYAKASGFVSDCKVDIGSVVSKGDELLHIDLPELADELRQAEAQVQSKRAAVKASKSKIQQAMLGIGITEAKAEQARAALKLRRITRDRTEQLYQGGATTEQARDEAQQQFAIAEAQLNIAKAEIENARGEKLTVEADLTVVEATVIEAEANVGRLRTLLKYANITAPFAGVVTMRMVDPGAFVRSAATGTSAPLLRLVRTDRLRLVLNIAETDTPDIKVGTPLGIEIPSLGGNALHAKVSRMADGLDPKTRTMRVEVDLDNPDGRLQPGMYAYAIFSIVGINQAVVIPSVAVRGSGQETYVLVVEGGIAKKKQITLRHDTGKWATIEKGLEGNEQVITKATSAVAPSVPVKPVPVRGLNTSQEK